MFKGLFKKKTPVKSEILQKVIEVNSKLKEEEWI